MGSVRPLHVEDLPRVAALWLRVYRRQERVPDAGLLDYFREMFLAGPCRDEALPSLVYEAGGALTGFVGVLARRMRFRGQPIRAAIATQLMVDPAAGAYAAPTLMRRYFAGPQELSYSDGATEASERLWRSCGGEVAQLYNLAWTRVLRPVQHLSALLERNPARARLARRLRPLISPVARPIDGLWGLAERRLAAGRAGDLVAEDATPETLAWCLRHLSGEAALRPEYPPGTLGWLLEQCARKRVHGELRRRVLRASNGDLAGWFLYYARPGAVAQVLQLGGRPPRIEAVLQALFDDARRAGAVAVSGALEPRFTKALSRSRCSLAWPGYCVLARAGNPEIAAAVHRGDALLSRLEGEWWARFSDPAWSAPGEPVTEEGIDACAVSQAS